MHLKLFDATCIIGSSNYLSQLLALTHLKSSLPLRSSKYLGKSSKGIHYDRQSLRHLNAHLTITIYDWVFDSDLTNAFCVNLNSVLVFSKAVPSIKK